MTIDQIAQVAIPCVALLGGAMVGERGRGRRLAGFLALLAGQPFWWWAALHPIQPGILLTTAGFTLVYLRGAWNNRPTKKAPESIGGLLDITV